MKITSYVYPYQKHQETLISRLYPSYTFNNLHAASSTVGGKGGGV